MLVESMTFAEVRREIEKDLEVVRRKSTYHCESILKVMRKTKISSFKKYFPYFSPSKNNWLYGIHVPEKNTDPVFYYMAYFYTEKGISVVQPLVSNALNYFNGHFFTQYDDRLKLQLRTPREWLIKFMDSTIGFASKNLFEVKPRVSECVAYACNGLCLGEYYHDVKIHFYRTFVSENLLFPDQLVIYNELKARHDDMVAECES
jgi:hypothetical protein